MSLRMIHDELDEMRSSRKGKGKELCKGNGSRWLSQVVVFLVVTAFFLRQLTGDDRFCGWLCVVSVVAWSLMNMRALYSWLCPLL
jgi:hypothetical protein